MRPLILVGASGLAREVLAVTRMDTPSRRVRLLDEDPTIWGSVRSGVTVEGGLELVHDEPQGEVVVCVGSSLARRAVVRRLTDLGVRRERFGRVIHPFADVGAGSTVGRGTILLSQVVLTADIHVGDHVVMMPSSTLTHDDVVEDFATLGAGVSLGGGVRVASGAYLGMNSSVREHTHVGRDSVLGMGAVLLHDLPAGQVWAGVPAAELRPVEEAAS